MNRGTHFPIIGEPNITQQEIDAHVDFIVQTAIHVKQSSSVLNRVIGSLSDELMRVLPSYEGINFKGTTYIVVGLVKVDTGSKEVIMPLNALFHNRKYKWAGESMTFWGNHTEVKNAIHALWMALAEIENNYAQMGPLMEDIKRKKITNVGRE